MKNKVFKLLLLIVMIAGFVACKEKKDKQTKPNIVFIFADQYRRASMGFLNEDPVKTPNIDALAKQGVFFSRAVANYPLCSPYRAMLMTGQYPLTNGVISNCHSGRTQYGNYLKKETTCFSDVLANNGYSAGYVGKWHLDGPKATKKGERVEWDTWCPPDRRHGFDFWYAYGTHGRHYHPYYWTTDAKEDEKTYVKQWSPEHEADVIIDYIDNSQKQRKDNAPFALFWSINPPHTPFNEVPESYKKGYKGIKAEQVLNRPNVMYDDDRSLKAGDGNVKQKIGMAPDYFASVNGVDAQIGRVVEHLKTTGLYDNTIIVFSSDHGEMMGSHGKMHKNIWFKESWEIPLIVHWPQKIKAKVEDLMISVPDYMPTMLGLLGLGNNIPKEVEGTDYSKVFFDSEDIQRPDKQLYLGASPQEPGEGKRGFRNASYTYVEIKNATEPNTCFLYNDLEDPYQMNNIWGQNKELDKQMALELRELLLKMNDPWVEHNHE